MGNYVMKLEDVKADTDRVGSKAQRLGSMLSAGLPVPSGFVLGTEAYVKFLRHNKLANKIGELIGEAHGSGFSNLRETSEQIQGLIKNGIMPEFIETEFRSEYQDLSIGREAKEIGGRALDLIRAGRDSAVVTLRPSPLTDSSSYLSGQMKSLIGVRGHQQIIEGIKEVWASLFTPRAMLYRKRRRITDMPSMGVIVQKSLGPEKSGFAFTSRPETDDLSVIVIEGAWGFSESITSGISMPDEYVVSKESGEVISRKVKEKAWMATLDGMTGKVKKESVLRERINAELLDSREVMKVCELAMKAERHFGGQPREVEWCVERGRMFIIDASHMPNYGIRGQPRDVQNMRPLGQGICAFRGTASGKARILISPSGMETLSSGDVIVTKSFLPDMLPMMDRVSGLVTEEASRMSQGAVIAREFSVPCIISVDGAVSGITDGEDVIMIGEEGRVFHVPDNPVNNYQEVQQLPAQAPAYQAREPGLQPSMPGSLGDESLTATGIRAIISLPSEMGDAPGLADGVGVIRGEHLMTETGKHPYLLMKENPEELIRSLINGLGGIAKAFYPKPVWYRSIDVRSDEYRDMGSGDNAEGNPIMGWRGIRRSLDQNDVLGIELEVIKKLHKEGLTNIALGLPFISSLEELRAVRQMAGYPLRIGIMIETPAAGLEIERFCKEGIAFAVIGLNDLVQLTLGVDRENPRVSGLYSDLNPAVMSLLRHILSTCRKYSVETSVYGDFVSDPSVAEALVSLGAGSISVEPGSIGEVKKIISRTERKLILENLRNRQQ